MTAALLDPVVASLVAVATVAAPALQVEAPSLAAVAGVVGLALTAGVIALLVAATYRFLTRLAMPTGVAVLIAVGVVAGYLNTTASLASVIGGGATPFDLPTVLRNLATLGGAAVLAPVGRRVGDHLGALGLSVAGARELDVEVERVVAAVGRVVTVTLPETIDDMPEHDPVAPETKDKLAGKTLVFPRRVTVGELRTRLADRLRDDYGIGHVDVDLAEDGSVAYLAVGSRPAGIGPTLPPGSVALAIYADPAYAASPGDRVQVWRPRDGGPVADSRAETDEDGAGAGGTDAGRPPELVGTAELRGTADDVVTLAVDRDLADELDDATRYRLATLPAATSPERAFAGVLRAADETLGVSTVAEGAALVGTTIGELDAAVVAVRPATGSIQAIPPGSYALSAGETVYAIGRPEALRSLALAAGGDAPSAEG